MQCTIPVEQRSDLPDVRYQLNHNPFIQLKSIIYLDEQLNLLCAYSSMCNVTTVKMLHAKCRNVVCKVQVTSSHVQKLIENWVSDLLIFACWDLGQLDQTARNLGQLIWVAAILLISSVASSQHWMIELGFAFKPYLKMVRIVQLCELFASEMGRRFRFWSSYQAYINV